MEKFNTIESTLFVPMLGRIWCTKNHPSVLNDQKALSLSGVIPQELKQHAKGTAYTKIASAVRSTNMDRYIQEFMKENPEGVIVQIGCGLETTYHRNDDGRHEWVELDLPEVIGFRKKILGETERDHCLIGDATSGEWLEEIRRKYPTRPLLVTASGVFYYFTEEMVLGLMENLHQDGHAELVFDTVSGFGMKLMHHLMKLVGHADAAIYFYVDKAGQLATEVGATLLKEEKYYKFIPRKGLPFQCKVNMFFSDLMKMTKMVHLKF